MTRNFLYLEEETAKSQYIEQEEQENVAGKTLAIASLRSSFSRHFAVVRPLYSLNLTEDK